MTPTALATFVEGLLGRPWRLGAQGPEAFDCWSLFRLIQREAFGREVPLVELPADTPRAAVSALLATHPGRSLWRPVARAVHGGAVEMTSVRTPLHVGVWLAIDGGLVLHCAEPAGITLDPLLALQAQGWRRFRFHDWAGPHGGGAVAEAAAA